MKPILSWILQRRKSSFVSSDLSLNWRIVFIFKAFIRRNKLMLFHLPERGKFLRFPITRSVLNFVDFDIKLPWNNFVELFKADASKSSVVIIRWTWTIGACYNLRTKGENLTPLPIVTPSFSKFFSLPFLFARQAKEELSSVRTF